jgi:hypothetical protein
VSPHARQNVKTSKRQNVKTTRKVSVSRLAPEPPSHWMIARFPLDDTAFRVRIKTLKEGDSKFKQRRRARFVWMNGNMGRKHG